jgi:hypothetical protein
VRSIPFVTLRAGVLTDLARTGETDTTVLADITSLINQALDFAYPWLHSGWPELVKATSETVTSQVIDRDTVGDGRFGVIRILRVTRKHPHTATNPEPLEYQETASGIVLQGTDLPTTAYVEHIEAPPIFDSTAWVTSTAYVVGDVRVNGTEAYYCLTAHTSGTFATDLAADKWEALPFPAFLQTPVRAAVVAAMKGTNGQTQTQIELLRNVLDPHLSNVALRYHQQR